MKTIVAIVLMTLCASWNAQAKKPEKVPTAESVEKVKQRIAELQEKLAYEAFSLSQFDVAKRNFSLAKEVFHKAEYDYYLARCEEAEANTTADIEMAVSFYDDFLTSLQERDQKMVDDAYVRVDMLRKRLDERKRIIALGQKAKVIPPAPPPPMLSPPPLLTESNVSSDEPTDTAPRKSTRTKTWFYTATVASALGVTLALVGGAVMSSAWDQRNMAVFTHDVALGNSAHSQFNAGAAVLGIGGAVLALDVYAVWRAVREADVK